MLYFLHKKPRMLQPKKDFEIMSLQSHKNKPKPPPLSQTIIQDIKNRKAREIRSVAGFFFLDSNKNPSFSYIRRYPYLNLPSPFFFNIPAPFTICSSSSGLLLCRDHSTGTYHVFNPLIHTPDSYRQIPAPYRTHQPDTPSVLIVDEVPDFLSFHVVCAVQESFRKYSFDVFSSSDDDWSSAGGGIKIKARCIVTNSGVSNHQRMAFWLTDVPYQVIKYTLDESGYEFSEMIDIPATLNPWARLQIGRLESDDIGLVASSRADVKLLRLWWNDNFDLYDWSEIGCLNVRRKEGAGGGSLEVVCLGATERPELMRFEKEVPMFTGERMVVWEVRFWSEHRVISTWTRMPPNVGDGVPYVTSGLVATAFRKMEAEWDEQDDDSDDMKVGGRELIRGV